MPAKPKLEDNDRLPDSSRGEVLIYQTDDGQINLDVRFENETLWLTQQMMADLFQSAKQYIGQHLKNIQAAKGSTPEKEILSKGARIHRNREIARFAPMRAAAMGKTFD